MRTRMPITRRASCKTTQIYMRHPLFRSHHGNPAAHSKFKAKHKLNNNISLPKVSVKHSLHLGSECKPRLSYFAYHSIIRLANKHPVAKRASSSALFDEKIHLLILLLLLYLFVTTEASANEQQQEDNADLETMKIKQSLVDIVRTSTYEDVAPFLQEWINNEPTNSQPYELQASVLLNNQNYNEVIAVYKEAKKRQAVSTQLYLFLGAAYRGLFEGEDSDKNYCVKKFLKYLHIVINDPAFDGNSKGLALSILGEYYFDTKQNDIASGYFAKSTVLIEDLARRAHVYYRLGQIYVEKDIRLARNYLVIAKHLDTNNLDIYMALVTVYEKIKFYHEALECYSEIFSKFSEPAALFHKGKLLYNLGFHEQACLTLDLFIKETQEYSPNEKVMFYKRSAYLLKAIALQQLENHEEAAISIEHAVALNMEAERVMYFKTCSLVMQGKFDQAEDYVTEALGSFAEKKINRSILELFYIRAFVFSEQYEEKMKEILLHKETHYEQNDDLTAKDIDKLRQQAVLFKTKCISDLQTIIFNADNGEDPSESQDVKLNAQRFLETFQAIPSFIRRKEDSALHLAARNDDVSRFEALNTDDNIESRNQDYQTPLHVAVNAGHKKVVDRLLELNANINATTVTISNQEHVREKEKIYKTAIELAEEKKQWTMLAALLNARQKYTEKDLQPVYDYFANRISKEELSVLLWQEDIKDITPHIQKYKAHLADRGGVIYETTSFGKKVSLTKEVTLTGWDPKIFLTLRIMAYIELLKDNHVILAGFGKINPETFGPQDYQQAKYYHDMVVINKVLKQEILLALELRRTMQDAKIVYKVLQDDSVDRETRDKIKSAHLGRVEREITKLEPGENYIYLTGIYNHHYIYVNFGSLFDKEKIVKQPYARIDDVGETGSSYHPKNHEFIKPCAFSFESGSEVKAYLNTLFTARFTALKQKKQNSSSVYNLFGLLAQSDNQDAIKKKVYNSIYSKPCCTLPISYLWPERFPAVTGNCAVKNYDIGMEIRVGSKLFYMISKEEYKKITEWDASSRAARLKILDNDRDFNIVEELQADAKQKSPRYKVGF